MSQYNGSDGVPAEDTNITASPTLETLIAALSAAVAPKHPAWVKDRPENNPIVFEPMPEGLMKEIKEAKKGSRMRYSAIKEAVQIIHLSVLEAVTGGGPAGVSSNDLYWAWDDSGYGEYVNLDTVITTLVSLDLVAYDPTLDEEQQVVATGTVDDIVWDEDDEEDATDHN